MKLKRNVVILSTNEKSKLVLAYNNKLAINHTYGLAKFDDATYQHLYITSDEEIKEGDWCYKQDVQGKVFKWVSTSNTWYKDAKKIIASTDKSLGLPSPSDGFVVKFITRYNDGNPITEVMVEYEEIGRMKSGGIETSISQQLKVDKNNCITITAVKESWTREEVIAIHKANCERLTNSYLSSDIEWIEQNL